MGSRNVVPDSARLLSCAGGPVTVGRRAGCHINLALYEGEASQGYKSDYERIPTRWLLVVVRAAKAGPTSGRILEQYCHQYSGHRLGRAWADYQSNVAALAGYVKAES
jgi:hypothetical protein